MRAQAISGKISDNQMFCSQEHDYYNDKNKSGFASRL
jgi:hypothetical protein